MYTAENLGLLQVPSSQKNQTIDFSWVHYCLVVSFLLLSVICASVPTEATENLLVNLISICSFSSCEQNFPKANYCNRLYQDGRLALLYAKSV